MVCIVVTGHRAPGDPSSRQVSALPVSLRAFLPAPWGKCSEKGGVQEAGETPQLLAAGLRGDLT